MMVARIPPEIPPEQSLIEYPSAFPIKVMGAQVEGFTEAIVGIAQVAQGKAGANTTNRTKMKRNETKRNEFRGRPGPELGMKGRAPLAERGGFEPPVRY